MSALQDILDKMYVDPELLEHLAEEQKLLLFIKMREEQIRRWKLNEDKAEREANLNGNKNSKKNDKRVKWRSGADGNVWVWVMGEHPDDPSIDDILADEAKEKARELAEKEILIESMRLDGSINENLDEEQLKNQLMEMRLYPGGDREAKTAITKNPRASPYDELNGGDNNFADNSNVTVRQPRQSLPGNFKGFMSGTNDNMITRRSYEPRQNLGSENNGGKLLYQSQSAPYSSNSYMNNELHENSRPSAGPPRRPMNSRRSEGNFPNSGGRLTANDDFVQFTRTYAPSGYGGGMTSESHGDNGVMANNGVLDSRRNNSSSTTLPSSTSPFPVGGNSGGQKPAPTKSPIASTTVFSSFAPQTTMSAFNNDNGNRNSDKSVADPTNSGISTNPKPGINVGGGRVTRIAARLSGGGNDFGRSTFYTSVTAAPPPIALTTSTSASSIPSRQQQQANVKSNGVIGNGVVAAGIGRFSMGGDGDKLAVGNREAPSFHRTYSASRIVLPSTSNLSSAAANDNKMMASGEYDNHSALNTDYAAGASYKPMSAKATRLTINNNENLVGATQKKLIENVQESDPMIRLHSTLRDQQKSYPPSHSFSDSVSMKVADPNAPQNRGAVMKTTLRSGVIPREKILTSVDNSEIEKRQSRILEQILEERDKMEREAEVEEQRQREAWEEQEKKAREAEAQIRLIAQKARQEHLKSLRTSSSLLPVLNDTSSTSLKDAIKNLPRPPKPKNRNAIVQWYKNVELPKRTGFDPSTGKPAIWFHGIISRTFAEELLADKAAGSFLVRASERIWGYTISYVVKDEVTKHFLVEKLTDGYQFLGTNQIVHQSLYDLVVYHKNTPITAKGKEFLRFPIGQQNSSSPDYADLVDHRSMPN